MSRPTKNHVRFSSEEPLPGTSNNSGKPLLNSSKQGSPADSSFNKRDTIAGQNEPMDPELARRLFDVGANLFLFDVPPHTEVGIDLNSWNVGPNFKGFKMIPPGIHFVYWSAVSKDGQVAPRSGFFYNFSPKEVHARRYNDRNEEFEEICDNAEEINRLRLNLKNLDPNLAAYPYASWKKWVSLTNKISVETIKRLEPTSGKIYSVTQLVSETFKSCSSSAMETNCTSSVQPRQYLMKTIGVEPTSSPITPSENSNSKRNLTDEEKEDDKLPKMLCVPNMKIRYTKISSQYPPGSTPAQITKHSMDSTWQLEQFMDVFKKLYGDVVSSTMTDRNQIEEVLGELQFSFVCFLVGQNYDSFEQWKMLLKMLLTSDDALARYTHLYLTLINDLHFQVIV